jgi:hypothetical protein
MAGARNPRLTRPIISDVLLRGRGPWFVLTACGVQAFILQPQSFHRTPADNVRVHDFIHVSQGNSAVPDGLGIDDKVRPVLTLVQASGLVGAYSAFQPALGQFLLEQLLQLGLLRRITTSARMSRWALVPANENMALEFRHGDIVQVSERKMKVVSGQWSVVSGQWGSRVSIGCGLTDNWSLTTSHCL